MAKTSTLKEKLDQQLARGVINLSSSDVAEFEKPVIKSEPVTGDTKVSVPKDMNKVDPMITAGISGAAGESVAKNMAKTAADSDIAGKLASDGVMFENVELTISESERNAFLECIVTGKRFELPFDIFNGRIVGKFRSRSQNESNAILSRLNWEMENKHIRSALEFSTRLRNMLLAAMVSEIRSTAYPSLKEPLYRTQDGDKIIEPGWLGQLEVWLNEHEGLISALYKQLQLFEQKYWVMVNNAGEQNFWHPAGSI